MAERFPDFEVEEIQELKENSENQNRKKSASTWLNVWTSWAKSKNFETNLLEYKAKQLDETLQTFFAEIRKAACKRTQQLATMLGAVASVLTVVCKRMQQLPTLLGPTLHRGKDTTNQSL